MALEPYMIAGGPVLLGVLIAAATFLKWPNWAFYVLAAVSAGFGVVALVV